MPGPKARRDGYRPRIGGPFRNRLNLTEDEYQVLIEIFNKYADGYTGRISRFKGSRKYTLEVRPFIRKLLKLGLKCGWTNVPACYRGPEIH